MCNTSSEVILQYLFNINNSNFNEFFQKFKYIIETHEENYLKKPSKEPTLGEK